MEDGKYLMLKQVLGMAFTRDEWVSKVRTSLERALGEYAKQKYADLADFQYDWSDEINGLLKKARHLCDLTTQTKSNFDKNKALLEAIGDAGDPVQVKDAQRSLLSYEELSAEQRRKIRSTPLFDADEILAEMLEKFPVQVK